MVKQPIWRIRKPPGAEASADISNFKPIEQALLISRGLRSSIDVDDFLSTDKPNFHDPFLLKGMDQGVELILNRIQSGGNICIYADYDADGITGASLLYSFFKDSQIESTVYFPDRFQEGYGLNDTAIQRLAAQGVNLLITIDCGIRGISEVEVARDLGMDIVITDHHLPGHELPGASCTINPRQSGDEYPFKELAGVGVAYKLAQALSMRAQNNIDVKDYLDLVAIGTVADIVPLIGENRHLVQQGLARLNDKPRPGVDALIHVSGAQPGHINAGTIGFGLAPRINAAGRLASASQAFELLTEVNREGAQALAERLDRLNKERQRLTNDVILKVEEQAPTSSQKIILSFDQDYHLGVVGLAASRVSDRYYRPAIIGTISGSETRASARSIPGFHITQALEEVAELLRRYGGHQSAAGFTIDNKNRDRFIDRLLDLVDRSIHSEMLIPVVEIDASIGLDSISEGLMAFLDALGPFGNKNAQPVFCAEGVSVLAKRTVGRDATHLKMTLERDGRPFDAIAFRMGDLAKGLPEIVDIAFHIERNNYLGYETLQLRVVDIRSANTLEDENLTEWIEVI